MPKRIDTAIDMRILTAHALGIPNKDIAAEYNVSPSYITKVTRGHKDIAVEVPRTDTKDILGVIERNGEPLTDDAIIKYLETQVASMSQRIKIYLMLLKKLKGETNGRPRKDFPERRLDTGSGRDDRADTYHADPNYTISAGSGYGPSDTTNSTTGVSYPTNTAITSADSTHPNGTYTPTGGAETGVTEARTKSDEGSAGQVFDRKDNPRKD